MGSLSEALPLRQQLELAVRSTRPHRLARAFASHAGQFYDRPRFDQLAREARALYAARSPADGDRFRTDLDDRLADRARPTVAWEAA
jgi:hypothetical protein